MENVEEIQAKIDVAVPGGVLELISNASPCAQHSLLLDPKAGLKIARLLRDNLGFDYCSNATGVDYPDQVEQVKNKVMKDVDGEQQEIEEVTEVVHPGRLEAVYHLYSMAERKGPLIIRMRTQDREQNVSLPSLTPVWRSCEFQEREIYDLYGVVFDGHPDLRRLLMWDEFTDFPMRKDYVDPDDYEYEPTAHDTVLARNQAQGGVA